MKVMMYFILYLLGDFHVFFGVIGICDTFENNFEVEH